MLYIDTTGIVGSKKHKKKQNFKHSDGYIEKYDFRGQPTIIVKDFEPEVFKLLIDYTHTGVVILQSRTLLGLMNAADHYCLEELKQACIRFMERCITIETVCILLITAEKYIQYKSTKTLIQKILDFVDLNAEAILSLEDFANLPQHIVRLVLGREELGASEIMKFEAAYQWALRYCRSFPETDIKVAFEPFVDVINYSRIPTRQLMQRVKKAGVVDDNHILTALAFQADPSSVLPPRPLSSASSAICVTNTSSTPTPRLTKIPTAPSISTQRPASSGQFRRVQSSGNHVDFGVNSTSSSSSSSVMADLRDARSGSVPLNTSEGDRRSPGRGGVDESYLRGTEVHPLRIHDVHDHSSSRSSSHLSVLSTPPLSPTPSLSAVSHQGSLVSLSSGDSVHAHGRMSPSGGLLHPGMGVGGVVVASGGPVQGKPGGPNLKRLSYNPQALDAIVNLSSSSAVEV